MLIQTDMEIEYIVHNTYFDAINTFIQRVKNLIKLKK